VAQLQLAARKANPQPMEWGLAASQKLDHL